MSTKMMRIRQTGMTTLVTLALLAGLSLGPRAARAQAVTCDDVAEFPCGFQIRDVALQRVPALFKLQARVAQAKLPIGQGLFQVIVVKLLQGTNVLCMEQFNDVQVRESVLNLEIGRNMTCEMDAVIAENNDLAFQICLGGYENCLKPVELAATPYAVKATYAHTAQSAAESNVAAQAHYAHRVTADRDMFLRKELGTGYFDFYTPADDEAGWLDDEQSFATYQDGGFLQWSPVRDDEAFKLHIVGKENGSDHLRELDDLVLASEHTWATGDLTVEPSPGGEGLTVTAQGAHVTGASDVDGTFYVSEATTVGSGGVHVTGDSDITGVTTITGDTNITGVTTVVGDTDITGVLGVSGATTVRSGGVHVFGDSDITGVTSITGDTHVIGDTDVTGTLAVTDSTTIHAGGVHVTGDSDITGVVHITGDTIVTGEGSVIGGLKVTEAATIESGGVHVTGDSDITGDVTITGDTTVTGTLHTTAAGIIESGGLQATGASSIDGTLELTDALTVTGGGAHVTGASDITGDTTLTGEASVIGNLKVSAGLTVEADGASVTGHTNLHGPAHIHGALDVADRATIHSGGFHVTGGSELHGELKVYDRFVVEAGGMWAAGDATLTGATAVENTLTVSDLLQVLSGGLQVTGATTLNGLLSVASGGLAVTGASDLNGDVDVEGDVVIHGSESDGLAVGTLTLESTVDGYVWDRLFMDGDEIDSNYGLMINYNSEAYTWFGGMVYAHRGAEIEEGLQVTGATTLDGLTSVTSGGLAVTGASTLDGLLTVSSGGLAVTGASDLDGDVDVEGDVVIHGSESDGFAFGTLTLESSYDDFVFNRLFMDGDEIDSNFDLFINYNSGTSTWFGGMIEATQGIHVNGPDNDGTTAALRVHSAGEDQTLLVDGNEIDSNGTLFLNHNSEHPVRVGGTLSLEGGMVFHDTDVGLSVEGGVLHIAGPVTFENPVTFDNGSSEVDPAYVLVSGEAREVGLHGGLKVMGDESDGVDNSALILESSTATGAMFLDNDEIDTESTLYLNDNSGHDVRTGGDLVVEGVAHLNGGAIVTPGMNVTGIVDAERLAVTQGASLPITQVIRDPEPSERTSEHASGDYHHYKVVYECSCREGPGDTNNYLVLSAWEYYTRSGYHARYAPTEFCRKVAAESNHEHAHCRVYKTMEGHQVRYEILADYIHPSHWDDMDEQEDLECGLVCLRLP